MKPNIIEIIWHDLGQYLSCYGKKYIKSPNLDTLAKEGVLLENAYCAAPLCSPSRASIMTGCYPHSNGMFGLSHVGWQYNNNQRLLTNILKESGYDTLLVGLEHEGKRINDQYIAAKLGYDNVLETESYHSEEVTEVACNFIESKKWDNPFFMSIGFHDVHRPNIEEVTKEEINNAKVPWYVYDCQGARKDMAIFYKKIEIADKQVGKILKAIKQSGQEKNTIILFTTDHGPELNRAKSTLYEEGIGVACIFKWKGKIQHNKRLKGLRSNIDIMPTLLDLVNITIPEFVQGESFRSSLVTDDDRSRDYIIAEKTYHGPYDPMRCIRNDKYKYIWNLKPHQPMSVSLEHSMAVGLDVTVNQYGYERAEEELYDIVNDIRESNNLAYKNEYKDIKVQLRNKLLQVLKETGDPILNEEVLPVIKKDVPRIEWIKETGKRANSGLADFKLVNNFPGLFK